MSISPAPVVYSADQSTEALEQRIHQYILDHPEVIVQAIERYQQRLQTARAERSKTVIATRGMELFHDPVTPAAGATENPITIVEFLDYRCAYCKRMDPTILKLLEENHGVRLVFKEFPILGPDSVIAAKASLASNLQGAYLKFHRALMNESGPLTLDTIERIAIGLGLNPAKLKQDMESPEVAAAIERNRHLAEALEVEATPSFVIGGELVSGSRDAANLRELIMKAQARK